MADGVTSNGGAAAAALSYGHYSRYQEPPLFYGEESRGTTLRAFCRDIGRWFRTQQAQGASMSALLGILEAAFPSDSTAARLWERHGNSFLETLKPDKSDAVERLQAWLNKEFAWMKDNAIQKVTTMTPAGRDLVAYLTEFGQMFAESQLPDQQGQLYLASHLHVEYPKYADYVLEKEGGTVADLLEELTRKYHKLRTMNSLSNRPAADLRTVAVSTAPAASVNPSPAAPEVQALKEQVERMRKQMQRMMEGNDRRKGNRVSRRDMTEDDSWRLQGSYATAAPASYPPPWVQPHAPAYQMQHYGPNPYAQQYYAPQYAQQVYNSPSYGPGPQYQEQRNPAWQGEYTDGLQGDGGYGSWQGGWTGGQQSTQHWPYSTDTYSPQDWQGLRRQHPPPQATSTRPPQAAPGQPQPIAISSTACTQGTQAPAPLPWPGGSTSLCMEAVRKGDDDGVYVSMHNTLATRPPIPFDPPSIKPTPISSKEAGILQTPLVPGKKQVMKKSAAPALTAEQGRVIEEETPAAGLGHVVIRPRELSRSELATLLKMAGTEGQIPITTTSMAFIQALMQKRGQAPEGAALTISTDGGCTACTSACATVCTTGAAMHEFDEVDEYAYQKQQYVGQGGCPVDVVLPCMPTNPTALCEAIWDWFQAAHHHLHVGQVMLTVGPVAEVKALCDGLMNGAGHERTGRQADGATLRATAQLLSSAMDGFGMLETVGPFYTQQHNTYVQHARALARTAHQLAAGLDSCCVSFGAASVSKGGDVPPAPADDSDGEPPTVEDCNGKEECEKSVDDSDDKWSNCAAIEWSSDGKKENSMKESGSASVQQQFVCTLKPTWTPKRKEGTHLTVSQAACTMAVQHRRWDPGGKV